MGHLVWRASLQRIDDGSNMERFAARILEGLLAIAEQRWRSLLPAFQPLVRSSGNRRGSGCLEVCATFKKVARPVCVNSHRRVMSLVFYLAPLVGSMFRHSIAGDYPHPR